jgi:hypothetical protein
VIRRFSDQLFFSKMTDPGDSGAVITEGRSNTVVGLNFAGDNLVSVANPLYQKSWSYIGTRALSAEFEVPVFSTTTSRSLATKPEGAAVPFAAVAHGREDFKLMDVPDVSSPKLPPVFLPGAPAAGYVVRTVSGAGTSYTRIHVEKIERVVGDWIWGQLAVPSEGFPPPTRTWGWFNPATGLFYTSQ